MKKHYFTIYTPHGAILPMCGQCISILITITVIASAGMVG